MPNNELDGHDVLGLKVLSACTPRRHGQYDVTTRMMFETGLQFRRPRRKESVSYFGDTSGEHKPTAPSGVKYLDWREHPYLCRCDEYKKFGNCDHQYVNACRAWMLHNCCCGYDSRTEKAVKPKTFHRYRFVLDDEFNFFLNEKGQVVCGDCVVPDVKTLIKDAIEMRIKVIRYSESGKMTILHYPSKLRAV